MHFGDQDVYESGSNDDEYSESDLASPADTARRALREIRRYRKLAQVGRGASDVRPGGRNMAPAVDRAARDSR